MHGTVIKKIKTNKQKMLLGFNNLTCLQLVLNLVVLLASYNP